MVAIMMMMMMIVFTLDQSRQGYSMVNGRADRKHIFSEQYCAPSCMSDLFSGWKSLCVKSDKWQSFPVGNLFLVTHMHSYFLMKRKGKKNLGKLPYREEGGKRLHLFHIKAINSFLSWVTGGGEPAALLSRKPLWLLLLWDRKDVLQWTNWES